MINIVLYEPEIPQNTGNISRTCAILGAKLHLVHPLGFKIDEKSIKRAGLDYWKELKITHHRNLKSFLEYAEDGKLHLITKFAYNTYSDVDYSNIEEDHYFIFGKETTGLPEKFMRENEENCVRIPMDDTHIRSLNLSNTASIIIYEVLRQQNFPNMDLQRHYLNDKLD